MPKNAENIAIETLLDVLHVIASDGFYKDADYIRDKLRACGVHQVTIAHAEA